MAKDSRPIGPCRFYRHVVRALKSFIQMSCVYKINPIPYFSDGASAAHINNLQLARSIYRNQFIRVVIVLLLCVGCDVTSVGSHLGADLSGCLAYRSSRRFDGLLQHHVKLTYCVLFLSHILAVLLSWYTRKKRVIWRWYIKYFRLTSHDTSRIMHFIVK
jgi:hypothetical protein